MQTNQVSLQPGQTTKFPYRFERFRHVVIAESERGLHLLTPAQGARDFDGSWKNQNVDAVNDGDVFTSLTTFYWPRTFPAVYLPEGTASRVCVDWRHELYPETATLEYSQDMVTWEPYSEEPLGPEPNQSVFLPNRSVYQGAWSQGWYRIRADLPRRMSWSGSGALHAVPSELVDMQLYGETQKKVSQIAAIGEDVQVREYDCGNQISVTNLRDDAVEIWLMIGGDR